MRRIRARSQHRPPFSGHARQLESDAADNAAFAGPMADALGIGDEQSSAPEGLSIPAMSTLEPNAEKAGPIKSDIHSACEGGAGNFRVQNRHELLARDRKVTALVAFLTKENVSAEQAKLFSDYTWAKVARRANVNMPYTESRAQVLAELARLDASVEEPHQSPPYPWCWGNPTVADCIRYGYCKRNPNCGD